MKARIKNTFKNKLHPYFILPLIAGIFTGSVIFLFKIACNFAVDTSVKIYGFVRENPIWLPLLILGAAVLGFISAIILRRNKDCRGGGIPTSIAILRGLITFSWLKSIFALFTASILTFVGGVPLGTEGPSVQMGTAVGKGTARIFAKNERALDRYIMTGGGCGGFAAATGAPLAGILFAIEEAHRRFSPLLFMTAAITVCSATATMRLFCTLSGVSPFLFNFRQDLTLPLKYLWVAIIIGALCALSAILFTRIYDAVGKLVNQRLKSIPFAVKTITVFAAVALLGFISGELIGSGHDLITELSNMRGIWYVLIIAFCVRALMLMFANTVGISGGIFVPTLTFGAIIGALFSKASVGLGIFPEEYFIVPIIIGMASFLAAASRTPITAIAFSVEALGGLSLTLPVTVGVALAYFIIELSGVTSLQDGVIEQKVESFHEGKLSAVIDTSFTVMPNSFADGKEVRNILWPPTCTVLSIRRPHAKDNLQHLETLGAGDILHIHYLTYDPEETKVSIEDIVGIQPKTVDPAKHFVDQHSHVVPDL